MFNELLAGITALIVSIGGFFAPQTQFSGFSDPFLSRQVATTSLASGLFLTTDGLNSYWASPGGGGSFPFTPTNYGGTLVNATTTPVWFKTGLPSIIATSSFSTYASSTQLSVSGAVDFDTFTSALLQTGAGGDVAEYAGTSCTNEFVRTLSALGIATCAAVQQADLNLSDITLVDFTNDAGFTTFGWPFTPATSWNATSTILRNTLGFIGNSSSTFHILNNTYASSTYLTADTATTTNFYGAMLRNCSSNNVLTWSDGLFGCEADDAGSGSSDIVLWANASTSPWVAQSLTALSSSTIAFLDMVRATSTDFISTNATSSILSVSSHLRSQGTTRLDNMTSALLLTGSTGVVAEYAGSTCTNQAVTAISALGAATCTTLTSAYVDSTIATFGFPFTPATTWNSTSTILNLSEGVFANASSTFHILKNTYASSSQISVSGILTIPAGTAPTVVTDGNCAIDTTDGQLVCDVGTRGALVLSRGAFGVTQQYASTTQGSGTTTYYSISPYNMTIQDVRCDFTRHMGVRLGDGTNWIAHIIASSTVGTTTPSSNNVFYRGEPFRWEFGTTTTDTGKEVRGGCTASYVINQE